METELPTLYLYGVRNAVKRQDVSSATKGVGYWFVVKPSATEMGRFDVNRLGAKPLYEGQHPFRVEGEDVIAGE